MTCTCSLFAAHVTFPHSESVVFPKLQSSLTGLFSRGFWSGVGTAPCAFVAEALPLAAYLPASVGLSLEELGSLGARADSCRADREMGKS